MRELRQIVRTWHFKASYKIICLIKSVNNKWLPQVGVSLPRATLTVTVSTLEGHSAVNFDEDAGVVLRLSTITLAGKGAGKCVVSTWLYFHLNFERSSATHKGSWKMKRVFVLERWNGERFAELCTIDGRWKP